MNEESKSILSNFFEENQFELDSYLTFLFDQINNDNENVSKV
ncbi:MULTISPECIES: hypothetical protein [Priestia]|jgi:hypothetical protein|nr:MULTISPECIES: hypothetical protein [Priestia]MDH6651490.1 hypothetical protein [Bacillus sp. PvP124]MDP9579414.1 hypothetical protein [Bacillus sp. 1751]MDH2449205.1 hypothetical protein [Priestia megaterium]MDL5148663.1 hypothetical protein [Priestia megaterium]MDP9726130.1 hypothetical protein [Priestia aryabhattai]